MRRKTFLTVFISLSLCLLLIAAGTAAAASSARGNQKPASPPRFREGQVVVAGSPAELPPDVTVIKYLPHANLSVLAAEKGKEWGLVQRFRARGRRAGLNHVAQISMVPNDESYNMQWNFNNVFFDNIQAEKAWDLNAGSGVTVAVLDTGLLPDGPDGINCVVDSYNARDFTKPPTDGHGHGTHVSGTIAQRTNNGIGVAGLAHESCIMPVKVCDDTGLECLSADIAEGVHYAVDNGAKVINLSLGEFGIESDPSVDTELDYAYSSGVTVVCASGNDNNFTTIRYPANYPTTIAVGALTIENVVTWYTNEGEDQTLVAPGGDWMDALFYGIGTQIYQETHNGAGAWGLHGMEGTSMAAPHVSAVAAMLISYGVATTPQEVHDALTETALDLGAPGWDTRYGSGLVQAYDALNYVSSCISEPEVCDDDDNDCDGFVDEGLPVLTYYQDADGDGYGESTNSKADCSQPAGFVDNDADCDDGNVASYPGAAEICDGLDNDCDDVVPAGEVDGDGDGYRLCDGDCNDSADTVFPGADEICDGADNDCDGVVPVGEADGDSDGYRLCHGDCNDTADTVSPGADEICDGLDNDCDSLKDEDFSGLGDSCSAGTGECSASGTIVCTADTQGTVCDAVPGSPTPEICGDDKDNDCDTLTDEDCGGGGCVNDADCDDGLFCNGGETCNGAGACLAGTPPSCDDGVNCTDDSCSESADACVNLANNANCGDDGLFCTGAEICDPQADCVSAGNPCSTGETCNEVTNSCDPDGGCTDADGDTWCVEDGDCVDNDATIYPGAEDICLDGIDQDCSGADRTKGKGCKNGGGGDSGGKEGKGKTCSDGIDNDGDGYIDCDDDGCASHKACR